MADQAVWFKAFVERTLQEMWEVPEIDEDDDGDYPYNDGISVSFVSLERACGHVQGMSSSIGKMSAVVHGGELALAEPEAS